MILPCMITNSIFLQFLMYYLTVCRDDEFPCLSGGCVSISARCNGYPDCEDRSDEQNCPTAAPPVSTERPYPISCAIGQRPCLSGNQCIYSQQWCNGRVDCNDLSDEAHCSKLLLIFKHQK